MNSNFPLLSRLVMVGVLATCMGVAHAAPPKEQKAIVQKAGSEAMQLQTVPVPTPGANQVLIRVYAAAVNPTDYKNGAPSTDVVPGGDVAGVVAAVGEGVTGFKVDDPVWGIALRRGVVLNGGYAEYAIATVANVAKKPANITFAQAAGLGIATVTGVRVIGETQVAKGQRVLITGVAGGVGSAAAQTAKARGAIVVGTASARHNEYLRSIGVDQVIDYTKGDFETQVGHVDVVIDTVGGDTATRAMKTLPHGGWFISTGSHDLDAQCAAAGLKCAPYSSAADVPHRIYEEVVSLVSAGKIAMKVDKSFPLADASKAREYSKDGHAEGKIILIVDAANAEKK